MNHLANRRPEEKEADARALLGVALPGATFTALGVKASLAGVPSLRISARIEISRLLRTGFGARPARSLQPATLQGLPAPSLLEGRTSPVVLTPAVTRSLWRVQLPAGTCPPVPDDAAIDNDLGSFHQKVTLEGSLLTVERRAEVKSRWIEPARFQALRELAVAESRAGRRLVNLECTVKGSVPGPAPTPSARPAGPR